MSSSDAAMQCMVNGKPNHQLSVLDRGLQFGDGLFETIAVREGQLVWWQHHMQRLRDGCQRLQFSVLPDTEVLFEEAQSLSNDCAAGVMKIIVTRGNSSRGYRIDSDQLPNRILLLKHGLRHNQANADHGIQVGICRHRLASNPCLAGIKHLNRLEQVLARREADIESWEEGLMLDQDDNLVEGTMSNLFVVVDGALVTPALEQAGIRGVTRDIIIKLAHHSGIAVQERELHSDELPHADEIFICNSIIGIWPVTRLGERQWRPGAITRRLQQILESNLCSVE